jgi:hypothetical protein
MNEGDPRQTTGPTAGRVIRRRRVGLLPCALLGAVLLFVVLHNGRQGPPADPEYVWLLTFPGTQPGVRFDTKRGDNLVSAVEESLPEDQTEWREILATTGEVKFGLFCEVEQQVSLWTRIQWLRMDHRWRPAVTYVGVGLPPVWLRTVSLAAPAYEVLRGQRGEEERVAGPFVKYEEARQAAILEIAKIMDRFQKGEKIEGSTEGLPAERP